MQRVHEADRWCRRTQAGKEPQRTLGNNKQHTLTHKLYKYIDLQQVCAALTWLETFKQ